jgi:hypothetical protein
MDTLTACSSTSPWGQTMTRRSLRDVVVRFGSHQRENRKCHGCACYCSSMRCSCWQVAKLRCVQRQMSISRSIELRISISLRVSDIRSAHAAMHHPKEPWKWEEGVGPSAKQLEALRSTKHKISRVHKSFAFCLQRRPPRLCSQNAASSARSARTYS